MIRAYDVGEREDGLIESLAYLWDEYVRHITFFQRATFAACARSSSSHFAACRICAWRRAMVASR